MTGTDIYVGFSINPELSFNPGSTNAEKGSDLDYSFRLSGSAVNIYKTLKAFDLSRTQVVGILSKEAVHEPDFQIVQDIMNTLIRNEGLDIYTINCMDRPNFAIANLETNTVSGQKGKILPDLVNGQLEKFGKNQGMKIATGIRPDEIDFAISFLGDKKGYRSLNLKPEVLADKKALEKILPHTDFLFMNKEEHENCALKFSEIHALGVNFVAVTMNKSGCAWSIKESPKEQHYVEGVSNPGPTFSTGCGDCFQGSLLGTFLCSGVDMENPTKEDFYRAVNVANYVAAKKATLPGGPNVPNKQFVKKVLSEL